MLPNSLQLKHMVTGPLLAGGLGVIASLLPRLHKAHQWCGWMMLILIDLLSSQQMPMPTSKYKIIMRLLPLLAAHHLFLARKDHRLRFSQRVLLYVALNVAHLPSDFFQKVIRRYDHNFSKRRTIVQRRHTFHGTQFQIHLIFNCDTNSCQMTLQRFFSLPIHT